MLGAALSSTFEVLHCVRPDRMAYVHKADFAFQVWPLRPSRMDCLPIFVMQPCRRRPKAFSCAVLSILVSKLRCGSCVKGAVSYTMQRPQVRTEPPSLSRSFLAAIVSLPTGCIHLPLLDYDPCKNSMQDSCCRRLRLNLTASS